MANTCNSTNGYVSQLAIIHPIINADQRRVIEIREHRQAETMLRPVDGLLFRVEVDFVSH